MTLVVIFGVTSLTYAQGNEYPPKPMVILDMQNPNNTFLDNESNYTCLRDIKCLKRQKRFNFKLEGNVRNANKYIVKGQSKNEHLYAEYGGNGKLINSRYVLLNVRVPGKIRQYLTSGEYEGWKMIGNEKTVLSFNPKTTEYSIILQKDNDSIVLYFDRLGNRKIPFMDT